MKRHTVEVVYEGREILTFDTEDDSEFDSKLEEATRHLDGWWVWDVKEEEIEG